MEAQIQVTKIYDNGNAPHKAVDAAGVQWKFWANKVSMVVGGVYNVSYEEQIYQGKTSLMVSGVTPVGAPQAPVAPIPPNPPMQTPQPVAQAPMPAQAIPQTNGRYTDQQRAQDIFVTGTVGRILSAKAATTEIGQADFHRFTKWAVAAWEGRHIPENAEPSEPEWQNLG